MPPQIKLPACYDTSYYEYIVDFAKVSPRPAFVCTKATEGSTIRDSKFLTYWADLKQDGIRRSCYHFHRKAVTASLQAANFINTVKAGGGATAQDYFVLDIEEGGETPAQIIAWLDQVEASFSNTIMLYSTTYLLNELAKKCTAAQLTRLKKYPLWIAWYPYFPDDFTELPASYYPPALGPVWMWQYSENAIVNGITGEVDANWIAPVFRAILGNVTTPADVITTPYPGITRTRSTINGWKVVLHEIDPAQVEIRSVYCSPLKTAQQVQAETGADLVINGGEWDRVRDTKNYTVCDGIVEVQRNSAQPSLQVTK
jgi:GH25 family lysozyme M1 (1,4-beta-N-acetylmuramidase)